MCGPQLLPLVFHDLNNLTYKILITANSRELIQWSNEKIKTWEAEISLSVFSTV